MSNEVEGEWTEERRQEFLQYLGIHLVAITGSYRHLDAARKPTGEEKKYNYSGCVVSLNSTWYVLTAGHAIQEFIGAVKSGGVLITGRVLADYFGVNAKNRDPFPFDIMDTSNVYIDDDILGLDYALLRLSEMQRKLLQANGIMPFPLYVTSRPSENEFYQYFVVGFPEERVDLTSTEMHQRVSIFLQPNCIPLKRLTNDTRTTHPRFQAEIVEMGDLNSIVGMSGGPIFGFVDRGSTQDCYLWAVQSRWDSRTRTVYGCLLDEVYADFQSKLHLQCEDGDLVPPQQ